MIAAAVSGMGIAAFQGGWPRVGRLLPLYAKNVTRIIDMEAVFQLVGESRDVGGPGYLNKLLES